MSVRPSDPRIRQQLAPATRPLTGVAVTGVLTSLLMIGQAWAVTELVVAALDGAAVVGWAALVAAVFTARGLVGWLGDCLAASAAATVGAGVRRRVLGAILSGAGRRRPSGELATLATRGAAAAEPYLTRYLPALVLAGVLPCLTLIAIAVVDPLSALIVLLTLPLIPVFGILVGLATRDQATSQWRTMASLSSHFVDVMRGLPTLVAFRRAGHQSGVIREVTDRYRRRTLATLKIAFASSGVLELVATISVALVAVTVGLRLAHGSIPLEQALVVLLLAPEAYWPLRRVGAEFHAAAEGVATFEAAAGLDPAGHVDPGDGRACRLAPGEAPARLVEVSLTYPGRRVPALRPLTVEIPARGVTAVAGPSGCGKSTLLAVLAGELEPSQGYADLPSPDQVAHLPQRPVFVAGTLADNLRLAAPDASEARLWEALEQVVLADRVRALPAGLDTSLGEDGGTLSGGERARLALARIVLSDRPWILLDEPTAHLDELTERVVSHTVARLGHTRAVVLVAHRPALLDLADGVVELVGAGETPAPPVDRGRVHLPGGTPRECTDSPGDGAPQPEGTASADTATIRAGALAQQEDTPPPLGRRRLWQATALAAGATLCGVALTATSGWLIVQASAMPPVLTLLVAIVGVRAFGLGRPVLRYAERLRSHDAALRLLGERRVEVYDAVVPLTPGGLRRDGRRRGDVLAAIVEDVDSVLDRELRVLLPVRSFVVVAAVVTLIAGVIAPVAAPVVLATAAVAGGAGYALARRGAARAEEIAVAARARLSEAVLETVQTAPELVRWQATGQALAGVREIEETLGRATRRSAWWSGAAQAVVLVVCGVAMGLMAVLTAPLVGSGELSGPMMALLVLVPLALAEPAAELATAGALDVRTRAALARLDALTEREPLVRDPEVARPAPDGTGLLLDGVRAGWGKRPAFEHLSLQVAPGERVGVVGRSGSGKSTLAALLLRFLDPTLGSVAIGGTPLPDLALDDVRRRVGLVDDDPHVFASTLAENVRFARPGASDDAVEDALRRAHLGGWVDDLPEGLGTRLGDGGAAVSGGERARLGVARSLLADQPVLVLDEPTAHLDTATARALAEEVLAEGGWAEEPSAEDRARGRRSVVWITHEPVGLDLVDRVVDLDVRAR